jgi:hypothetical protein
VRKLKGYLDDRGEVVELTGEQYQFFLWNGFPKGVVVLKTPEAPENEK